MHIIDHGDGMVEIVNDMLVVKELRPMTEAPMETSILAIRHGFVRFELITWPCCGEFIGWIPVPVYKP